MTAIRGQGRWAAFLPALLGMAAAAGTVGCQQKMAEQPYYRPYEPTISFPDGRSNRPLEPGTIHRAQRLEFDPLVTGLTTEEWSRAWKADSPGRKVDVNAAAKDEDRETAVGAPRFDPKTKGFDATRYGGTPHPGPQVYVEEFPFPITAADLRRGQERFTIYCAACHGPLGNGKGKVWERGYLKPTSYHTEPVSDNETAATGRAAEQRNGVWYDKDGPDQPLGFSRGYWRWGIHVPVREVPVGYIFEVITRGYGQMPDHAAQVAPADRWRIIAYVRALQLSQHADPAAAARILGQPAEGKK